MNRRIKIKESTLRSIIKNSLNEVMGELNLYHGTNADFDRFDTAFMSTGWGQQAHGYGFYLTSSYDVAKDYAYNDKTGQVMEVEVPDGKYLNNKSISMVEKNRIARKLFKYMTVENPDSRESYPNEDTRKCLWDYEISYILNCSDGEHVYGTIASIIGSYKDTSEFLHDKCGYIGLKIRDIYADEKRPPFNYVIFSQDDIKILRKNVLNEEVSLVKQEHTNRGWHYHPYKRYPVFQADDLYENIDKRQDVGDIEKSVNDKAVGRFGMFRLSSALRSCIYEAAFQLLNFERFAINGEITFGDVMDNPWDDAYHVIKWAIDNKGLDNEYLNRISGQLDDNYVQAVQNGKAFWFSKEELGEIFKVLPDTLRKELVKDIINVSRIGKINEMVEYLKNYNGGNNLEEFIQVMKTKYRNGEIKRGGISNLKEPVRQAIVDYRMLKA